LKLEDTINNRIRKILTNGTIVTVAGTGVGGFNFDGILATDAKLNHPISLAVDANDIVYFTDTNNQRIRVILENGNISTVIGTGVGGFNGDYLSPNNTSCIRDPLYSSGDCTKLNNPQNIAFDPSGNLYFAGKSF